MIGWVSNYVISGGGAEWYLQGVLHGILTFLAVSHINAEMNTRDVKAIRKLKILN